jgi:hypothetical protein
MGRSVADGLKNKYDPIYFFRRIPSDQSGERMLRMILIAWIDRERKGIIKLGPRATSAYNLLPLQSSPVQRRSEAVMFHVG